MKHRIIGSMLGGRMPKRSSLNLVGATVAQDVGYNHYFAPDLDNAATLRRSFPAQFKGILVSVNERAESDIRYSGQFVPIEQR